MIEESTHRVSVVIPSWNGRDLLRACLRSLAKQTFVAFDTIVVDDGSTDGTAETVAREFPKVQVLRTEQNRGFCNAVNTGIEHAGGRWVLLLNNDMTLQPDFIEELMTAAALTGATMLAPLVLWRDEPETIYSAGDRQLTNGRPESIGFGAPLAGFSFSDRVFGASAGAALYRREIFDAVGSLDPCFDIYFSDSDLSFRARLAGFEARFARAAVAHHVGSASLQGRTLKRTRQCYINHAILVIKNMPLPLLARHLPEIARERLHQSHRLFAAARTEHGALRAAGTVATAWFQLITLLPHAFAARWKIQRTRRLEIAELEALLSR